MKKRLFTFFMGIFMLIPTMFGLTGCGGNKNKVSYDDYEEIKEIVSTIINSYDTLRNSEDVAMAKPHNNSFASTSNEFSVDDILDMLDSSESKFICQTSKTWFDSTTQSLFAMALAGGKIMAEDYKDPNYYGTVLKAWEGSEPTPENPDAQIAYEYFQLKEVDKYNKTLLVYGPESDFYLKMTIYFKDESDFRVEYLGYDPAANGTDFDLLNYQYADSQRNLINIHYQNYGSEEMCIATWHNGIDTFQIEQGVLNSTADACIDYIIERNNPMANYDEITSVGTTPKYTFHYDRMWKAFDDLMGDFADALEDMDTGTPFTGMIQNGCLTGINYSYVKEEVLTLPAGIDSITWGLHIPNTVKKIIIPNNVKYIKVRETEYNTALECYNDAQNNPVSIAKQSSRRAFVGSVGGQETYVNLPAELAPYISSPLFSVVGPDGNWLPGSEEATFSNIEFSTSEAQTLFSYTEDRGGVCVTLNDFNDQPQTLCFALKNPIKLFKDALEDVVFEDNTCSLLDYCINKIKETGTNILPSATMETQRKIFDGEIDPITFVKTITYNFTDVSNSSPNTDMFRKQDPQTYETMKGLYTIDKVTLNFTITKPENMQNYVASLRFDDSSIKTIRVLEINTNAEQIAIGASTNNRIEFESIYLTGDNVTFVHVDSIILKAQNLDLPANTDELVLRNFTSTSNLTINSNNIVAIIDRYDDPEHGEYTYKYTEYQISIDPHIIQYETTDFVVKDLPVINGKFVLNLGESLDNLTDRTFAWERDFIADYGDTDDEKKQTAWVLYNILKHYPEKIDIAGPLSAVIFGGEKVADGEYKISLTNTIDEIDLKDYFYNAYGSTYKLSTTNNFTTPLSETEVELEYGDNIYYLELTSAAKQETKVYKLNFYRKAKYIATMMDKNGLIDKLDDVAFDENKLTFMLPIGYTAESVEIVTYPRSGAIPTPTEPGKYKITFEFDSNVNSNFYYFDGDADSSIDGNFTFYKQNPSTMEYELETDPYGVAAHFRVECYITKYNSCELSFRFYDEHTRESSIAITNVLYYEYTNIYTSLENAYPSAIFSTRTDSETNRKVYTISGISENVDLAVAAELQEFKVKAIIYNQEKFESGTDKDGNPMYYYKTDVLERNLTVGTYTVKDSKFYLPVGGIAGYKITTGGIYLTGEEDWSSGYENYILSDKVENGYISTEGVYGIQLYVTGVEEKVWNVKYNLGDLTADTSDTHEWPTTLNGAEYNYWDWNGLYDITMGLINPDDSTYEIEWSLSPDFEDAKQDSQLYTNIIDLTKYYDYDDDTITVYARKAYREYTISFFLPYWDEEFDIADFQEFIAIVEGIGFTTTNYSDGTPSYRYKYVFTVISEGFVMPEITCLPEKYAQGLYNGSEKFTGLTTGTNYDISLSIETQEWIDQITDQQ